MADGEEEENKKEKESLKDRLRKRAKRLKVDIPAVLLTLGDRETPPAAKITAWITAAYALSPVDLIPDFIPVLGYLDDLIILPALIALTVRLIPPEVWRKNRALAEKRLSEESGGAGMKKRWYYAVPVVVIWLLLAALCAKALIKWLL